MIRVLLPICDKHLWVLQPFSYLFNKFWSEQQPVLVAGFKTPDFQLPKNFAFKSLGPVDPGPQVWSDQLMKALDCIPDDHIVLMLEDYWLCRGVDHKGVETLHEYCKLHPEVIRMDLTADRLYAGGMFEVDRYGSYDIVETNSETPYQMSTQAAIWHRSKLLSLLKPGMNPWEVEVQTTIKEPMRVLGSRQWPVRYSNVFNSAKGEEMQQLDLIPKEHIDYMRSKGWIK